MIGASPEGPIWSFTSEQDSYFDYADTAPSAPLSVIIIADSPTVICGPWAVGCGCDRDEPAEATDAEVRAAIAALEEEADHE